MAKKSQQQDQNQENTSPEEQLKQQTDQIESLQNELQEAKQQIADQESLIADLRKDVGRGAKSTFELDGNTYEVLVGVFNFEGKHYSADQLSKDPVLQKKLVAKRAGVIRRI